MSEPYPEIDADFRKYARRHRVIDIVKAMETLLSKELARLNRATGNPTNNDAQTMLLQEAAIRISAYLEVPVEIKSSSETIQ
jgi:hypothetical protein